MDSGDGRREVSNGAVLRTRESVEVWYIPVCWLTNHVSKCPDLQVPGTTDAYNAAHHLYLLPCFLIL